MCEKLCEQKSVGNTVKKHVKTRERTFERNNGATFHTRSLPNAPRVLMAPCLKYCKYKQNLTRSESAKLGNSQRENKNDKLDLSRIAAE